MHLMEREPLKGFPFCAARGGVWVLLEDDTGFSEGVVGASAAFRVADDDVVEKAELKDFRGVNEAAGKI